MTLTIEDARIKAAARTTYGAPVPTGPVPTLARPDDVDQAIQEVDAARAVFDRMAAELDAARRKLAEAERKDRDAIVTYINDPTGPKPKDTVQAARRAVEVAEHYVEAARERLVTAEDEVKALMLVYREQWHADIVTETERLRSEAEAAGREYQDRLNAVYKAAQEAQALARLRPANPDGGFDQGPAPVAPPNVLAPLSQRPEYPAFSLGTKGIVPVDLDAIDRLMPRSVWAQPAAPSNLRPGPDGVHRLTEPEPNGPGFDSKPKVEPYRDPHAGSVLSHGLDA